MKVVLVLLLAAFTWIGTFSTARAAVDWEEIKELSLEKPPLDIAASLNGDFIFVLVPGAVLVYGEKEDRPMNRIPLDQGFDRVTWSEKNKTLILTSTSSKTVKLLRLEEIYRLDVSGLPFKGGPDAPVTMVVFSDYQ
ncbi:MAG: hypothetical protein P8175_01325 [Deltaproteobacteria bacterium]